MIVIKTCKRMRQIYCGGHGRGPAFKSLSSEVLVLAAPGDVWGPCYCRPCLSLLPKCSINSKHAEVSASRGALLTHIRVGVLTMRHARLVLRNTAKLLTVTLSDVRSAIEIEYACHAVRRSVKMLV